MIGSTLKQRKTDMPKNNFDRLELADKFIQMSEKFMNIYARGRMEVRFSVTELNEHPCGTVACHGGYGLIALRDEMPEIKDEKSFVEGSRAIALFLGFIDEADYIQWANEYPEYWGCEHGKWMFTFQGRRAFNLEYPSTNSTSLLTIAIWYANVAARLIGVTPYEIHYDSETYRGTYPGRPNTTCFVKTRKGIDYFV